MNYSRQSSNGVVVENKDGEIYVNGKHIETGKRTFLSYFTKYLLYSAMFWVGYVFGTFNA